jgi:hypothetical protein
VTNPAVLTTNAVVYAPGKVTFPVVSRLEGDHFAIVAMVHATDTKIEFNINVRAAPVVTAAALLAHREFGRGRGLGHRNLHDSVPKGWTAAILAAGIGKYKEIYRRPPDCMVGVFGDENLKRFLAAFSRLYPNTALSKMSETARVAAARACISETPFWPPREKIYPDLANRTKWVLAV